MLQMKSLIKKLPRVGIAVVIIGSVIVVGPQLDSRPSLTIPALYFLWCFSGLWVMGPLRSVKRSQALIAVFALVLTI